MSGFSPIDAETSLLHEGWSLVLTAPGAFSGPAELPATLDAIPAIVPGTVAAALDAIGRFDRNRPEPLTGKDAWYRLRLPHGAVGPAILHFEGLATVAEAFLDGKLILSSESMFEAHDVPVVLAGGEELAVCFRALGPHLERTGPRARWRPRLMNAQGLRLIRTTALGFMPGWCPEIHAVGPWRPVKLIRKQAFTSSPIVSAKLAEDGTGILKVSFVYEGSVRDFRLACDGRETHFTATEGRYSAELHIPDIKPWWPHTHGEPNLYDVMLRVDGADRLLCRTGFRRIEVDRGKDDQSFGLILNGEKIFCRGSVWTAADIVRLPGDRKSYEPWLRLAKEAGMNMIRIPGIAAYETPDFFALCDELGLMVWQDFMFANFDYPAGDPDFVIHVKTEAEQFLAATQASPSLAVLCGGSEIHQQGAMLGLPERIWKGPLCEEILAGIAAEKRPDVPYVPNSPYGGALPFYPNAGIAHYYGVGAYKRPLEDARRANIRFAAECLAFSNLSATETLAGGKEGIPRDSGADWDFEDVRDHYLGLLYGVDPQKLRENDFERYLALSRVVTGEVMETAFAEWRRPGSTCNGALTFTLQDVMPGPGWGVVDVGGRPKPAWYALKRAFRPIQLILADEGTNGLDLHLINETAFSLSAILEISCLREGKMPVVSARRELAVDPRNSRTFAATDLFGAFFDTNYAYRFGPPSHDLTVSRLKHAETGEVIAEAFHFPLGRAEAFHDAVIETTLTEDEEGYRLELSTNCLAQSVAIEAPGFRAADNWFHLAPGETRRVRLTALEGTAPGRPSGTVRALGGERAVPF